MARSHDNAVTTAVLALTAGALFGAVAALLLAPAPGSETRKRLCGFQEDATERVRRYAREARLRASGGRKGEDLHYDGGDAWI